MEFTTITVIIFATLAFLNTCGTLIISLYLRDIANAMLEMSDDE
jgi:hypothetical protein